MRYLVTDVETGGFQGTSLLSAYFGLLDDKLNLIDELNLFVKPDDGIYAVTAEALGVNKISLIEHDKVAITYKEAGTKLYQFLHKNYINGEKPLPLGHNVAFDVVRIKQDLISEGSWNNFVSYRVVDTGTIGTYLKILGKIPSDISGSLSSYAKHFGIDFSGAHDAKNDCIMTTLVFKEMLKL